MHQRVTPEVRNADPRGHGRQLGAGGGANKAAYLGAKVAVRASLHQSP
jgi:hypothetical protein